MSSGEGPRILPRPPDTPFLRFGRTHGLGAMSDAMLAVALAGSIFFSIDPDAARWRVALYLILTIAPFAVVTPLLGPLVDRIRGGRRGMIVTTIVARLLIAWQMIEHLDGLLLFPLAFGLLVMQKTYSIAKSAVVPSLVRNELELVEANAKLAMVSALFSMMGAGIGGIALMVSTSSPAVVAVVGYGLALVAAVQVPKVLVAPTPATAGERAELRQRGILTASFAVGLLRAVVGFTSFLLAFEFRGSGEGVSIDVSGRAAGAGTGVVREASELAGAAAPAWHFGLVLGAVGVGAFMAAQFSPRLRRWRQEERIIRGVLFVGAALSCGAVWLGGLPGAVVIGAVVATCSGTAKLAFDSLVQRDAPGANHGRSFARFEGRFQLAWAVGGFLAVFLPLSVEVGYVVIAGSFTVALTWFGLASPPAPRIIPPTEPQRPDGQLGFWRREDLED